MVLKRILICMLAFLYTGTAYCQVTGSQEDERAAKRHCVSLDPVDYAEGSQEVILLPSASLDSSAPLTQEDEGPAFVLLTPTASVASVSSYALPLSQGAPSPVESQEEFPSPPFKTKQEDLLFPFETSLHTQWNGHHRSIASTQVGLDTLQEILPSIASFWQARFVFLLESLITNKPDAGALLSAIHTLTKVPACDRLKAMERFAQFVMDDLTGQQRAIVLENLQKVPEDKFEEYKGIAEALNLPYMQSIDRAIIMRGLCYLPQGFNQKTFLRGVKQWWPLIPPGEERFELRFALTRPPLLPRKLKFRNELREVREFEPQSPYQPSPTPPIDAIEMD